MAVSRTTRRTMAEELAGFAAHARFEELSEQALAELKVRALDALGCALGALGAEPVAAIRKRVGDFGGNPRASLIGGGRTASDRAALHNGALVRRLRRGLSGRRLLR